jgi:site-specific recombinase XerD
MDAHQNQKSVVLGTLANYKNWLETLNYSATTIKNNPKYVSEFIQWSGITETNQINSENLQGWFDHLTTRKHKKKAAGLSLNYIKGYRNALSQYSKYLKEMGQPGFDLNVNLKAKESTEREVLTRKEIQQLYEATNYYTDPGIESKGLLAARERAILGLFYGCGLRKNEGQNVEVKDLDFKQNLLYIRKGKNYKERYVPIPVGVKKDFIHYLNYARPQLISRSRPGGKQHERFLTGWYGSPLKGSAILDRVQILGEIAKINKPIGLHTLRHSIATHLLQSGMKLEQIARFLGHSSLESTTIYTHLSADM